MFCKILIYYPFLSSESIRFGRLIYNINKSQLNYVNSDCDFYSEFVIIKFHFRYEEI
jgi:hypothetical protein